MTLTEVERRARHADQQRAYRARHPERARACVRAWNERHPERKRASHAADYARDPAKYRAKAKAWREANLERAQARERAWRAAHSAKMTGYRRAWHDASPTRAKAVRAATTANRRARLAGVDGVITYEVVLEIWRVQTACLGCGVGYGIDHIVPFARGGANTSGNLQNLCHPCNARKGTSVAA